jgi:hypothetical protein
MNYKKEEAASLMQKLNIELKPEDRDKDGKALLKVTMAQLYLVMELKLVSTHHPGVSACTNFECMSLGCNENVAARW